MAADGSARLSLASPVPLRLEDGEARATFPLRSGETAAFVLRWDEETPRPIADYDIPWKLGNTEAYWRLKTSDWRYRGRWSALVKRSVLALHQLLYAPSGAICAAVTTSLPGQIGGPRNWDYRFCWLRDAAFTLDIFHRLGHTADTSPFLGWLSHFSAAFPDDVHTLYGIGYETEIQESVLDHLEGYKGSRPVRIGNAASTAGPAGLSTASCSSPWLPTTAPAATSTTPSGAWWRGSSKGRWPTGACSITASGRCAASGATSSTPR